MATITISKDCGNSPKNIFLQKMVTAVANGDIDILHGSVSPDIRWNRVGNRLVQGREEFASAYTGRYEAISSLHILHVVSHGKAGAVDGKIYLHNGNVFAFCDVFEFTNARGISIKEITSFDIEIDQ